MGKIDEVCQEVVNRVDGGVACGVVDLDTGMLLGLFNAAGYPQTLNEIVGAAAVDLFRGPSVTRIEELVRSHRGQAEDGRHYLQEVHITTENSCHFVKTIREGRAVVVLVTRRSTNLGMGWAQLKSAIPSIEPLVP